MNEQRTDTPAECTICGRKDLRGAVGLAVHVQRAHKRNWSTRKKEARG